MSITVIFGSDGGTTKAIASSIASKCRARLVDIADAKITDFETCELLILGSPTYGDGTLQIDWEYNLDKIRKADLKGRKVALFGTGDQIGFPASFLDAVGILYDEVMQRGAEVIGFTETAGFDYIQSTAERDGMFVGLGLDVYAQTGQIEKRVTAWLNDVLCLEPAL